MANDKYGHKNIENYNQRLYINEGGIGDEITQLVEALKNADKLEQSDTMYGLQQNYNLDEYDNAGYNLEDDEKFKPEEGEDE